MDEVNFIRCRRCQKIVHYTPANTVIYFYTEYRWYSVAQTICDFCQHPQACFLVRNLDWEIRWAIENDLGFVMIQEMPSDEVMEAFHELYPEYPRLHELEDNEDALVQYFAYLLDTDPEEKWFD